MIYLDNAATTFPKPPVVYEKTLQFMREAGGNPGRGGHHYSTESSQVVEETRRQLARLFHIPDYRRVIFTYNCTDSINIVLKGMLKSGDHVIASNLDHNAVSRPLEHLSSARNLRITRIPFDEGGLLNPDRVRREIVDSTRLIVLNHGSNVLGSVQPLEPFLKLAVESRVPLLLDAAQTAGRIAIKIGNAPVFVTCSGHKNLYGMPGIGILTVPADTSLEKWREGGTGTISEDLHHPEELPMRLEAGTPNFLSIASVLFGLEFIAKEGMAKIHERELELMKRLNTALMSDDRFRVYSAAGLDERLGIVAFNLRATAPEEVAAILDQNFGIAVRDGLHCAAVLHNQLGTVPAGCLRVSPGYFNKLEDIESLISALKQIADSY